MSWDIIFWDKSVDYVPSSWGNNEKNIYVWPSHIRSNEKIREIIDECKPPSQQGRWTEHQAVFKRTVCNLRQANELCEKLQFESNLSSDDIEDDMDRSNNDHEPPQTSSQSEVITENDNNVVPESDELRNIVSDPVIKKVFESLEEIKINQKILKTEIIQMKHLLEKLVGGNKDLSRLAQSKFKLPLENDQNVLDMEDILTNEEDVSSLVHDLSLVGGDTTHKTVLNVMKKVMNRELSMQYSSKGKKGKKDFSKLKICNAVITAVRVRFPTATDTEIMKDIGTALATAADRDGGRKIRKNQQP